MCYIMMLGIEKSLQLVRREGESWWGGLEITPYRESWRVFLSLIVGEKGRKINGYRLVKITDLHFLCIIIFTKQYENSYLFH